jgi:hypothetical protein
VGFGRQQQDDTGGEDELRILKDMRLSRENFLFKNTMQKKHYECQVDEETNYK